MKALAIVGLWCAIAFPALAGSDQPRVVLSKPPPGLIRVGQHVTVTGRVRRAPAHTWAALQTGGHPRWTTVARASLGAQAAFTIRWHVSGSAGPLRLRVAALREGRVIAATRPRRSAVGPKAIYCAPPVPPAVDIPVGSGWIVGGLYLEGGPYPGIFECEQQRYTINVETPSGRTVARQTVAAGHSYTLVVPAGSYKLRSNVGCLGSATVTAGHQTKANTICNIP